LTVNHILDKYRTQVHRICKLVKFFDSPKQSQRLDIAQIELYKQKNLNETFLNPVQSNDTNDSEYDSDFENAEDEIEINSYLIEAKKFPFDSITEYFSAARYPTIAFIFPLIEMMKYHYALNIDINDDSRINNEEVANFDSESESSSESSEINLDLTIKKIQTDIYNSLFEYWDNLSKICLLATLLDPRLKEIVFTGSEVCNDTIRECRYQLRLTDVQQISETPEELESYDDVLDESNTSNTSLNSSRPFSKKMVEDIIF
ncbi:3376_t:CDS:2, partial [Racocetra persica]